MIDSNGAGEVEKPKGSGLHSLLAGLLIMVVAVVIYYNTHNFDLVYDDLHIIVHNSSINTLQENPSGLFSLFAQEFWAGSHEGTADEAFFQPQGQALYRPVMLATYGIIWYLFENNPVPFHLLNIFMYALVCLAVFLFIKQLFGSFRMAFFTGLIFACLPIHSEAVAYVTGLGELMGALFFLLALIFYYKASHVEERIKFVPYLLSLLCFLIGLFTKEHVISLLGVIVFMDILLAVGGRKTVGMGPRLGLYAGFLLIIGLNLLARYNAIGSLAPTEQNPLDNVIAATAGYDTRLWTAIQVLAKGIWLTIFPLHLCPDYSFSAIIISKSPFGSDVLPGLIFIVLLLVIAFATIKKIPALSFGIFWYFITIFLVSNIPVVIGTIFGERLLFLPSLGFCLVAAFILDRIFDMGRSKQGKFGAGAMVASILCILLAGAYAVKSYKECAKWKSDDDLFEAAKEVNPGSARIRFQLGQIYAQNKIFQEAQKELSIALTIEPSFVMARVNLAELFLAQRQYEKALEVYETVKMGTGLLQSDALAKQVHGRLAALNMMLQKADSAIEELNAMKTQENSPFINLQIGDLYIKEGKFEEAAAAYQEAWDLDPAHFDAAYRLLVTYTQSGKKEMEEALLTRLENEDTGSNQAFLYRASLHLKNFEADKAIAAFDKAIERKPDDPMAYHQKAQALKAEFRFDEALVALDKTLALTPPQGKTGPLLLKLEIYKEKNDMEKAEETVAALKELPLTAAVKAAIGDLYIRTERYEEASQYLMEAIAGGMEAVVNYVNLGTALFKQGKYEDVVAFLLPAVEDKNVSDRQVYATLGISLITTGEYQKGVDLLRQTLYNWGPYPGLKYQIVLGELGLKNYEAARQVLASLEADPATPQALAPGLRHLEARLFLEDEAAKDPAMAVARIREAFSLFPELFPGGPVGNPDMYITLIKALNASDKPEEAKKAAEEGRAAFPDDKALRDFVEGME